MDWLDLLGVQGTLKSLLQHHSSKASILMSVRKLLIRYIGQSVNHLPTAQETWVRFLGWEDPLEEGMATHSSTLAWRIPGMGEPDGLPSMGSHRVGHD